MKYNKQNYLISMGVVAIVMAGAGFFGGMKYQQSQRKTFTMGMNGQFTGRNGQGGMMTNGGANGSSNRQGGGNMMFRPVSGEIVSLEKDTFTIKTQDGGNKIVSFSDSVKVNKSSEATVADLKVGEQVMVIGNESNGVVGAQSINMGNFAFGRMGSQSQNAK